jgi:hypothetical protein
MKPMDNNGRQLDAIFAVEPNPEGAYLILESRGGGEGGPRAPRNADYSKGMELLLSRLGAQGAILRDVEVFSRVTQDWPTDERRLVAPDFPYPIDLSTLRDLRDFRHQLGRASAVLGRAGTSGGSPTKRLRLTLDWQGAVGRSAGELEDLLAHVKRTVSDEGLQYAPLGAFLRGRKDRELTLTLGDISSIVARPLPRAAWTRQFWANARDHHYSRRGQWLDAGYDAFFQSRAETVLFRRRDSEIVLEQSTDDPVELAERVRSATVRIEQAGAAPPPPPGSFTVRETTGSQSRYVRDPNVIAWVLLVANGVCEACDQPAPFLNSEGDPFLEVHHVRPLGEGGPDVTENAVAICPNCHRRLHFGEDREAFRTETISRNGRLKDFPREEREPSTEEMPPQD